MTEQNIYSGAKHNSINQQLHMYSIKTPGIKQEEILCVVPAVNIRAKIYPEWILFIDTGKDQMDGMLRKILQNDRKECIEYCKYLTKEMQM